MPAGLRRGAFAFADAGRARAPEAVLAPRIVAPRPRAHVVDVAVGIARDANGRVLVAERTARQISAGYWELPGGKIDAGETPAQAAARELTEEVGIAARTLRPWIVYDHAFTLKRVRLHFFRIDAWTGTPHGREGQRIAWIDPADPAVEPILPSNRRVLAALGLPPVYAVSPGGDARDAEGFIALLPALLRRGVRLIRVREPHLTPDVRSAFARRAVELAGSAGARIVLSGSVLEAARAGVTGVHSCSRELRRLSARPPVDLWLVTCHDAVEAARAVELGADAVVLDRARLGAERAGALAAALPVPAFFAGGLTPNDVPAAQRAGAAGVVCERIDLLV
jgi:8-oxo-dGTP diphosphatase